MIAGLIQDVLLIKETQGLKRAQRLRQSTVLSPRRQESRLEFIKLNLQSWIKPRQKDSNPMTDPNQMETTMEMMKKNVMMIVPQTVIMSWISYFFEGFVLTRLPFVVTLRFKDMLQRGIDTRDMDVRYKAMNFSMNSKGIHAKLLPYYLIIARSDDSKPPNILYLFQS